MFNLSRKKNKAATSFNVRKSSFVHAAIYEIIVMKHNSCIKITENKLSWKCSLPEVNLILIAVVNSFVKDVLIRTGARRRAQTVCSLYVLRLVKVQQIHFFLSIVKDILETHCNSINNYGKGSFSITKCPRASPCYSLLLAGNPLKLRGEFRTEVSTAAFSRKSGEKSAEQSGADTKLLA